ncbi:MAG: hypothetical protein WC356_01395 [Candidatus Micrarchaeia archaeon]|jgi:hypothetical protein
MLSEINTKIQRDFFPVPLQDRAIQIFLNTKILSAKIFGGNSISSKNKLSNHLWELAEYFAENNQFAKAAKFALKSSKLLSLDTDISEDLYIERMLFASKNLLLASKKALELTKLGKNLDCLFKLRYITEELKPFMQNKLDSDKNYIDFLNLKRDLFLAFSNRKEYYQVIYEKTEDPFVLGKLYNLKRVLNELEQEL